METHTRRTRPRKHIEAEIDIADAFMGAIFGVWCAMIVERMLFNLALYAFFICCIGVLVVGMLRLIQGDSMWSWAIAIALHWTSVGIWWHHSVIYGSHVHGGTVAFGIFVVLMWTACLVLAKRGIIYAGLRPSEG